MTVGVRETLTDASGRTLATFLRGRRDDLPLADDLRPQPDAGAQEVAAAVERRLPGHIVGAPKVIGELLVLRGATVRRRSTLMEIDLSLPGPAAPAPPDGITIEGASGRTPAELLDAYIDAYPTEHPDHHVGLDRDGQREMLRALMDGEVIGPLLNCSRVAIGSRGCDGAALVFDPLGEPPLGGPWVGEFFRHPRAPRGTGAALLAATLDAARADGLARIGLRMSSGNPARGLYYRLGFRPREEVVTVLVAGPG